MDRGFNPKYEDEDGFYDEEEDDFDDHPHYNTDKDFMNEFPYEHFHKRQQKRNKRDFSRARIAGRHHPRFNRHDRRRALSREMDPYYD